LRNSVGPLPTLPLGSATQAAGLVDGEKVEDVVRTREAKEKWREALETADEETAKSAAPGSSFKLRGDYLAKVAESMGDSYTFAQVRYDGPYPDLILTFELRNLGRRPAKDVDGRMTFDTDFLEPIEFPGMEGTIFQGRDFDLEFGYTTLKRMSLEVGTVPPYPSEKNFIFRIALLKKSPGKTAAVAVFSTPEGDYLEERIPL
jgi:hypothetical protein